MGFMAVLRDYGCELSLGYMLYYRSLDVEWLWCKSIRFCYKLTWVGVPDFPSGRAFSICRWKADAETVINRIVFPSPVLFVLGDFTPLATIRRRVRSGHSEYYLSEVMSLEETAEAPVSSDLDVYAADVGEDGDRHLSNPMDGPDIRLFVSILGDFDQI